jgi:hypothetical protein
MAYPVAPAQPVGLANESFTYSNLTGAATYNVKTSSGTLHSIVVNTAGGTTPSLTIYDNTAGSGTKIGTISGTAIAAGASFFYDVVFNTGLTIVQVGTGDYTVTYR